MLLKKTIITSSQTRKLASLQKWNDDYLYISGQTEPIQGNSETLAVRIFKACWLVRKRNGTISMVSGKTCLSFAAASD